MFTGIITDSGKIAAIVEKNEVVRFSIHTKFDLQSVEIGESIALNGVCLTVIEIDTQKNAISFDIIPETLDKTNLGERKVGDVVNLERSMQVGDRISGHFVMGHVDGVTKVVEIVDRGDSQRIYFALPASFKKYVKTKGSIALDGTSLTVSAVEDDRFSVDFVPHTLEVTTFGNVSLGSTINFEIDMLARYVHDSVK